MLHERIKLDINYEAAGLSNTTTAYLDTYVIEPNTEMAGVTSRPAVIICPGGGYAFCSQREAEPVARAFSAAGMQTFVLWYTTNDLHFPCQLLQAAQAVATVRKHADTWCINPNNISILGFSAGGHLAGSLGVLWNREYVKNVLGYHQREHRPDKMILCYPVITSGTFAHRNSFTRLLKGCDTDTLLDEVSLEKQVSEDTVPTFLWHTYDDGAVPVENSLLFATALRRHKIPLEMHIFPHGKHGMSTAAQEVGGGPAECAAWVNMAIRWIEQPYSSKDEI